MNFLCFLKKHKWKYSENIKRFPSLIGPIDIKISKRVCSKCIRKESRIGDHSWIRVHDYTIEENRELKLRELIGK